MKIAIIYNRESRNVINLFGVPNKERYGKTTIKRMTDALKKGGHNVRTFEADKLLINKLEQFMPRVLKGELPGMAFNVSYGIQGQARYTHVPGILEMIGIPYTGSDPLAHSLALDKVVAKMIFRQHGLPTPNFTVLDNPRFEMPDLQFPMIVKPKNEAVSFGLKIVDDEQELREAAQIIFDEFHQPVLVEQYIDGREINIGMLGNDPPDLLPPVEVLFGDEGWPIYTYEDKTKTSGREILLQCPADISDEIQTQAWVLAQTAFRVLGCRDFARVDMRMDGEDNLYILEINSLPSLGAGSSYVLAAKEVGLDYDALINRLIEVAGARYFGTPKPPVLYSGRYSNREEMAFSFLTQRRDQIERRVSEWCSISSRTGDPVGVRLAAQELSSTMANIKMRPVEKVTDNHSVWMWTTKKGHEGGTLLIAHLDVPLPIKTPVQTYRREPEYLCGEGIGVSRSPLVMMEFVLRALRTQKILDRVPLGVICYADEGFDALYSENAIREATAKAARVLVLLPGDPGDKAVTQRRGQIKYRLIVEGTPLKLGQPGKHIEPLVWLSSKITEISKITSRNKRLAVSVMDLKADGFPMLLPHCITSTVSISYYDDNVLEEAMVEIKRILGRPTAGLRWKLEDMSDRPPMKGRKINKALHRSLAEVAQSWDIPFEVTSSLRPSVAGLVPEITPVICGIGPVAENLYTPRECVQRISLIQRTLLLTQFLLKELQ